MVDKTTKQLGIYHPSEEFVARGEEKVNRAVSVYHKFFGENPKDDINEYFITEEL